MNRNLRQQNAHTHTHSKFANKTARRTRWKYVCAMFDGNNAQLFGSLCCDRYGGPEWQIPAHTRTHAPIDARNSKHMRRQIPCGTTGTGALEAALSPSVTKTRARARTHSQPPEHYDDDCLFIYASDEHSLTHSSSRSSDPRGPIINRNDVHKSSHIRTQNINTVRLI